MVFKRYYKYFESSFFYIVDYYFKTDWKGEGIYKR